MTGLAHTPAARQQRIAVILDRTAVRSQSELAKLLAHEGIETTQATLSRDLERLGAVRVRGEDGGLVYAVPGEGGDRTPRPGSAAGEPGVLDPRLRKVATEVLVSAEASANLVVVRTPPGAAQYLASALDRADLAPILGCVAGDDTVMLIARDPDGGQALARWLLSITQTDLD